MVGTKSGGKKASDQNKKKYGEDFYKNIGSLGGRKTGVLKGFALDPERAKIAGARGGRISRRGKGPGKVKEYVYHGDGKFKMEVKSEAQE
jgi:general stress protein YciG